MQVYNTPFGSQMGTGPPMGAWGPSSMFLRVDGGCFRISRSARQGAHRLCFFNVDGVRSRISVNTR
jgi:hypothetical protein